MKDVNVDVKRQKWKLLACPPVKSLQLDFSTWPTFPFPTPSLLLSSHLHSSSSSLFPFTSLSSGATSQLVPPLSFCDFIISWYINSCLCFPPTPSPSPSTLSRVASCLVTFSNSTWLCRQGKAIAARAAAGKIKCWPSQKATAVLFVYAHAKSAESLKGNQTHSQTSGVCWEPSPQLLVIKALETDFRHIGNLSKNAYGQSEDLENFQEH